MGNPKQKWTSEEEEALRAGVAKHGAGKWKNIQKDPEFNPFLFARSNIDLKDKWRNLSVANGQGPRDKSKTQKAKVNAAESPALPPLVPKISTSVAPMPPNASNDVLALEAPRPFHEGNNTAKYNAVICEAISSLNEANGSECSAIAAFIEQKQEVPPNFKRLLSSKLRRLVHQNKLEKVQNSYRLKRETPHSKRMSMAPIEPLPKQMQTGHSPQPRGDHFEETIENAAISAALRIAEAENISFVAAEATKEAERVSRMAEHQNLLIAFCLECLERSSHGDVLIRQ